MSYGVSHLTVPKYCKSVSQQGDSLVTDPINHKPYEVSTLRKLLLALESDPHSSWGQLRV